MTESETWWDKEGQFMFPGMHEALAEFNKKERVDKEIELIIPTLLY